MQTLFGVAKESDIQANKLKANIVLHITANTLRSFLYLQVLSQTEGLFMTA